MAGIILHREGLLFNIYKIIRLLFVVAAFDFLQNKQGITKQLVMPVQTGIHGW